MIYFILTVEIIATYIEIFTCLYLIRAFNNCELEGLKRDIIAALILSCICFLANKFKLFSFSTTIIMVFLISYVGSNKGSSEFIDCLSITSSYMMCIYIFDFMSLSVIGFIKGNVRFAEEMVSYYSINRCVFLVISKTGLILFFLFMRHIINNKRIIITKKMYLFPLLGFIGMIFLIKVTLNSVDFYSVFSWSMMMTFLILLCFLFIYYTRYRGEKERAELIELKNYLSENALNEFIIYRKECKELSHDMNKHCIILYDLIKMEKVTEALQYLKEIQEPLSLSESLSWTGNEIIDFILNYSEHICTNGNIKLQITADTIYNLEISPKDLCSIFMNLIDNAVEACLKVDQFEKRYINIVIRKVRQMLLIQMENSYKVHPIIIRKSLITTKDNKKFHGLGIKSVESAVKKYNGDFDYDFNENSFRINIIFYNI